MITLLILFAGLQVHEWGVITQSPSMITGAIPEMVELEYSLEDKAPVLYFHGDPCNISVRITFPTMGYATTVLPEPDQGGSNSTYILWQDLELTESRNSDMTLGWQQSEQLNYPVSLWREVQSLWVNNEERTDQFIYYECVPGSPGDLPYISESGNQSFRMPYGEIPCLILKPVDGQLMFGVFTLADIKTDIPKGLQFLEDPLHLKRVLWSWADGILFEDEFEAFWNTWEAKFLSDSSGDVMVLYRVPDEIMENIACVEVTPEDQIEVNFSRYIIAELPYRTQ